MQARSTHYHANKHRTIGKTALFPINPLLEAEKNLETKTDRSSEIGQSEWLSPYVRLVMDGPGRGWVRAEDREVQS
jgi:hypothetical protein